MPRKPRQRSTRRGRRERRGNVLVFSAVLMVAMMATVAFAVDVGYLCIAREELQRSADAAALAAAWELVDEQALSGQSNSSVLVQNAYTVAQQYAGLNKVLLESPGLSSSDVTVGYVADLQAGSITINTGTVSAPNVVHVRVRRDASQNGRLPLFFARVLGMNDAAASAEATAAVLTNFKGLKVPSDQSNLGILPFALDETTWNTMLAGGGSDNYRWDDETNTLQAGSDGIREVNLYPQGTGAPGNRGTVDIGSSNNSTADISRQIRQGITPADLSHHGGKLEFDSSGTLYLNGDTGISAGIKDDLASILGETRIIPIFRSVAGPGNNATYTIVQFVGIRVMNVKLTGSNSSKNVMVQPANVVTKGAIPSTTGGTSRYIYSPVWLVR